MTVVEKCPRAWFGDPFEDENFNVRQQGAQRDALSMRGRKELFAAGFPQGGCDLFNAQAIGVSLDYRCTRCGLQALRAQPVVCRERIEIDSDQGAHELLCLRSGTHHRFGFQEILDTMRAPFTAVA